MKKIIFIKLSGKLFVLYCLFVFNFTIVNAQLPFGSEGFGGGCVVSNSVGELVPLDLYGREGIDLKVDKNVTSVLSEKNYQFNEKWLFSVNGGDINLGFLGHYVWGFPDLKSLERSREYIGYRLLNKETMPAYQEMMRFLREVDHPIAREFENAAQTLWIYEMPYHFNLNAWNKLKEMNSPICQSPEGFNLNRNEFIPVMLYLGTNGSSHTSHVLLSSPIWNLLPLAYQSAMLVHEVGRRLQDEDGESLVDEELYQVVFNLIDKNSDLRFLNDVFVKFPRAKIEVRDRLFLNNLKTNLLEQCQKLRDISNINGEEIYSLCQHVNGIEAFDGILDVLGDLMRKIRAEFLDSSRLTNRQREELTELNDLFFSIYRRLLFRRLKVLDNSLVGGRSVTPQSQGSFDLYKISLESLIDNKLLLDEKGSKVELPDLPVNTKETWWNRFSTGEFRD